MGERSDYAREYLEQYIGSIDKEVVWVGKFLFRYVKGRVLDLGCGPSLHIWAFFMVDAMRIEGVDIVRESIDVFEEEIHRPERYRPYEKMIRDEFCIRSYHLENQIKKIAGIELLDFTKPLPLPEDSYDVVLFTYSLGCVKNKSDADGALKNAFRVLKPGGLLISVNTNGMNANPIIPEYTWQGIPQEPKFFVALIAAAGFVLPQTCSIRVNNSGLFRYDQTYIIRATKPELNSSLINC